MVLQQRNFTNIPAAGQTPSAVINANSLFSAYGMMKMILCLAHLLSSILWLSILGLIMGKGHGGRNVNISTNNQKFSSSGLVILMKGNMRNCQRQ